MLLQPVCFLSFSYNYGYGLEPKSGKEEDVSYGDVGFVEIMLLCIVEEHEGENC